MIVVRSVKELQDILKTETSVGLVPTMGNLHVGHLALMAEAKRHCKLLVASIFVNRLQFGPNEDFDTYPRTLEEDCAKLKEQGVVDIVFAPSEAEMYPQKQTYRIKPDSSMADILEGFYRPGFFEGVCTVVGKLFSIVRPNVAVFGKKDYQQLQIIRSMVRQFAMPIEIIGLELQRDSQSGLAFSSRNRYLSTKELKKASELYQTIQVVKKALEAGNVNVDEIEKRACSLLTQQGWQTDYVSVVRQVDLLAPTESDLINKEPLAVLAAAKIGTTRLIDNCEVF